MNKENGQVLLNVTHFLINKIFYGAGYNQRQKCSLILLACI